MKEALEKFIQEHSPLPGLAAWGALLSDRSVISHCYTNWFNDPQVERILNRMTLALEGLAYHHVEPVRLCWVFEHARIHLALRADGTCLAFFIENRPGLATAGLEQALDEFAGRFPGNRLSKR